MQKIHNISKLKDRRRELRQKSTPQEKKLWEELRDSKLGPKFKRQHSIGGYIIDFYCRKYKLIVEIDGDIHNTKEAREYDEERDKHFMGLGYKVLRFKNGEVENDLSSVLKNIINSKHKARF